MVMKADFDAYVTEALVERSGVAFALGDGTIAWDNGPRIVAHEGAILCAALHPTKDGVMSGGDDGRLAWTTPSGSVTLAEVRGRWIDAVAEAGASGLIAFASGRDVHVLDGSAPDFRRVFSHAATVSALAFDPKGRRLAAATYNGAALWYARIVDQQPVMLRWAGSHIAATFSPDGKFLISSMQEAALHGWRISDAMDMRMGGYPAKVKNLTFLDRGQWLATSGARGVVLWPFVGANGPMGKQAVEIGFDDHALVTRVAADPAGPRLAAGLDDGRIWFCDIGDHHTRTIRGESGIPISALALAGPGSIAWGDENGGAGIIDTTAL